jgi:hypothetical protein
MKNFLAAFNALPSILAIVQAVELAVPVSGAGKQKLDIVLGAAGAAWEATNTQHQLSKDTTVNLVQALVSITIAGLNAAAAIRALPHTAPAPVSSK